MDGRMKTAAEIGNIDLLYDLIRENSKVLDDIDGVPFIESPLHVAASGGKISFAMEILRLKPSFSRKLNEDGYSPMHLALFNGQNKMVVGFVEHESDLVRIQGKEGKTLLHHVAEQGDVDLLCKFLSACPLSIRDVTVHGETALHVAVKNEKVEALDVLLGGVLTACHKGSYIQEKLVLNRKDVQGRTALHIAIATSQIQAVRLLVKSGIDVNAKDDEGQTALDILRNPQDSREVEEILLHAKALKGDSLPYSNPYTHGHMHHRMSNLTSSERRHISIIRTKKNMDNATRNVILVVATLIVTATYQASLSPPGGLWQDDRTGSNSNNNINTPKVAHNITLNYNSSTCTITYTTAYNNSNDGGSSNSESETQKAGLIIMSTRNFFVFYVANSLTLLTTTLVICFLLPGDNMNWLFVCPLYSFSCCYIFAWTIISPGHIYIFLDGSNFVVVIWALTYSVACYCFRLLSKYSRKFDQTASL